MLYQGAILLGALGEEHLDSSGGVTLSDEEYRLYFGAKDPIEQFIERSRGE